LLLLLQLPSLLVMRDSCSCCCVCLASEAVFRGNGEMRWQWGSSSMGSMGSNPSKLRLGVDLHFLSFACDGKYLPIIIVGGIISCCCCCSCCRCRCCCCRCCCCAIWATGSEAGRAASAEVVVTVVASSFDDEFKLTWLGSFVLVNICTSMLLPLPVPKYLLWFSFSDIRRARWRFFILLQELNIYIYTPLYIQVIFHYSSKLQWSWLIVASSIAAAQHLNYLPMLLLWHM